MLGGGGLGLFTIGACMEGLAVLMSLFFQTETNVIRRNRKGGSAIGDVPANCTNQILRSIGTALACLACPIRVQVVVRHFETQAEFFLDKAPTDRNRRRESLKIEQK